MTTGCPNLECINYQSMLLCKKDGYYFRKDDSRKIQRYKCQRCLKKFSASTHTLEWKQKKRRVNHSLFQILSSGVSMRRSALILRIHKTTVERKLRYLAQKARSDHAEFLNKIAVSKTVHLQFDDLITTEHTKLKPLSIDAKRRFILCTSVSRIPAFGHLAALSVTNMEKGRAPIKSIFTSYLKKLHLL